MAWNEALTQYMKCYQCERYDSCADVEEKLKYACNLPTFPFGSNLRGIPGVPYKSKYFDDRRYDPPKPMTFCELEKALYKLRMEESNA